MIFVRTVLAALIAIDVQGIGAQAGPASMPAMTH